jgi:T5SS/PEP-CTERM-associated repeat protein
MKTRNHFPVVALVLFALVSPHSAHAQFTGNNQTNIINGVVSNWTRDYYVGSNYVSDALFIQNGGKLFVTIGYGYIGYNMGANNNSAVISGNGSTWSSEYGLYVGYSGAANNLVIQNGGRLFETNGSGYIGYNTGANNNSVVISGNGSTWSNEFGLYVGYGGIANSLVISNGGGVNDGVHADHGDYIGYNANANSNSVVVSGSGSVWSNGYGPYVGYSGSGNSLVISNGGQVSGSITIGYNVGADSNSAVVTGGGSTCGGDYVGLQGSGNRLVISNGGQVFGSWGTIGNNDGADSNSVVVSGTGSVWTNSVGLYVGRNGSGNSLGISNGGQVFVGSGGSSHIGGAGANSNSVTVSGSGSIWNCGFTYVGDYGAGNSLVISNGAKVFGDAGYIGYNAGANSNSLVVSGIGSVWSNRIVLAVGVNGGGNSLIIRDGGTVIATNGGAGANPGSTNNLITISGGNLIVTNSGGDARFNIRRGLLTFDGGTITVDNLLLTNGLASVMAFNSGLLNVKATAVTNTQQFIVGDGTNVGNLHLLGGTHSFNDGLRIRANSLLTGCGTVNGSVVVDAGAVARSDCSALTFSGNVTNNGTMLADAAVLESSGTLVNNGTIYLFNGGTTNFHGTFINNGSTLTVGAPTISSISRVGNDMTIQVPSIPVLTYQLQSSPALPSGWADSGAPQTGTGGPLTFTDLGAATNASSLFYRVRAY